MSKSVRLIALESRLESLRDNLLPAAFSETGDYSDQQLDSARGYRLLAHAEIESYLEDIAKSTVRDAVSIWKNDKMVNVTLIAFLASYHSCWSTDDNLSNESIIQIAKSRRAFNSIEKIIDHAHTQFIQRVKDNHGVKENNFYTLLLPTGVDLSIFEGDLVPNLNSFGSLRGEIAHSTRAATREINPKDELNSIAEILIGLNSLDSKIKELN